MSLSGKQGSEGGLDLGPKQEDGSGSSSSETADGGPGPGGGSKSDPLAERDPSRKPVAFKDEEVIVPVGPGETSPGGEEYLSEPTEGEARIAYEKVLVKYRAEMEKALDQEAYPEEYRRAVRDYFDSLK